MESIIPVASWIPVITFSSEFAVSSAILLPFSTAFMEFSISTAVFWEASADLLARFLTSSATTANPLPALPALAASTAAFSARIFVWNAISSIVLMIFPISPEDVLISDIAASISCILRLLSPASSPTSTDFLLASWAPSALRLIFVEISLIVAASSSTEEACSVAPWESACAPLDTWSAPEDTCPAETFKVESVALKLSLIFTIEAKIFW